MGTTRYVGAQERERLSPDELERRRTRIALVHDLQAARERDEPWYVWIRDGCQPITPEEWARTRPTRASHGKAAEQYEAAAPPRAEAVAAPLW